MRFKKLRVFIAVALIIFILVVANIIVFGLMQNKLQLAANVDDKKNIQNITIVKNTINTQQTAEASTNQNIQTSINPQATTPATLPTPTPVITHPRMITRAS